jgi:hypothetical protein
MNMKLYFWTLFSLLILTFASPIPTPELGNRELELVERETSLNAFLTILLGYLPAVNGAISAVAGILTTFEALLADLTGEQTTYNELGQACTKYTVIFARGTCIYFSAHWVRLRCHANWLPPKMSHEALSQLSILME